MTKFFLISTVLLLAGCASPLKDRSPTSDSKATLATIKINLLEEIYRFALENQSTSRILSYPVNEPSDLEDGGNFSKIEALKGQVDATRLIFDEEISSIDRGDFDHQEFRVTISDSVRERILPRFTSQEKRQLIGFCFGPKGQGDVYQTSFQLTYACNHFNFLITEEDIANSLKSIPDNPTGVRYLGGQGWHAFSDQDLEYHIQILTLAIATDKERFIRIFDQQEQKVRDKFRHNRHGMSESDKTEPFDLLANYSTWAIIGQTQGQSDYGDLNRIYIGKLVQKSLSRLFQMSKLDPESDKLPTLSVMKKNDRALFWCASGRFKPKPRTPQNKNVGTTHRAYGTDLLEGLTPAFRLSELLNGGRLGFIVNCNTMEYKVAVETQKAEEINPPQPIDYSDQDNIEVLITVALVSEMSSTSLSIGKTFLRTLGGWKLVENFKEIDTKRAFAQLLPKTDLYIPVSHSMDVNAFHVGTKNGFSLKLRRQVITESGDKKYINATILLPRSEEGLSSPVIMSPDSLSKLLFERDRNNREPLFLMNTSCASEKTLFTWMATHRKVLEKKLSTKRIADISEDMTTPHIIGSKRFFATNSTSAIISHLSFPVGAMDMLAEGYSVPEVVEFLKEDKKNGFADKILNLFNTSSNEEDDLSSKSFEPDYIMDHPELLSIGGYKIRVNRRGLPYEHEY